MKVYGIGICDLKDEDKRAYNSWVHILRKCSQGASICEEWKKFSSFYMWYWGEVRELYGEKLSLYNLGDEYNPENCVFLPISVIRFINNKKINNSSGYLGVHWHKRRGLWEVQIRDFETHKNIFGGVFNDLESAKRCYERLRNEQIEKVREYLRLLGYDERVVLCLE